MKRNIIGVFVAICCAFIVGNLLVTANETQRMPQPQVDYHENSSNNGNGYFRHVVATLGIANLTHNTALASGNQDSDEKSIPRWQVYQNDKIRFDLGVAIKNVSNENERSFESIQLHAHISENIILDTSDEVVILINNRNVSLSWENIQYDPINHTIDVSLTPNQLGVSADYKGSFTIGFLGQVAGNFVIGDYTNLPLNLTVTYKSLAGTEFISGVTSLYYSDMKATGDKSVKNISSTSSEYRVGDEIQYAITYRNEMNQTGTAIQNILVEDNMPKGFNYDNTSLKIYSVTSSGVETDITNDPGTTISDNTKDHLKLGFAEVKAGTSVKVVYNGWITTDFETPVITNIATIKGGDGVSGEEDLVNTIDITLDRVGTVNVDYVDENGGKLAPSVSAFGNEGTNYDVAPIEIKGYSLKEMPDNAKGLFTAGVQTVTFVYISENIDPVDPQNPIAPANPLGPKEPVDPEKNSESAKQNPSKVSKEKQTVPSLPLTGEKISMISIIVGVLMLIFGLLLFVKNKKDTKQD